MKLASALVPALALASTIGLTACQGPQFSTFLAPGETYSPIPPRLVRRGTGVSNDAYVCASAIPNAPPPSRLVSREFDCTDNTKRTALSWDHPEYFGPVPPEMKERAEAVCASLGPNRIPTGWHPKAQFYDGTTAPNGGFYCGIK